MQLYKTSLDLHTCYDVKSLFLNFLTVKRLHLFILSFIRKNTEFHNNRPFQTKSRQIKQNTLRDQDILYYLCDNFFPINFTDKRVKKYQLSTCSTQFYNFKEKHRPQHVTCNFTSLNCTEYASTTAQNKKRTFYIMLLLKSNHFRTFFCQTIG